MNYKLLFYGLLSIIFLGVCFNSYHFNTIDATKYRNVFHSLLEVRVKLEQEIINKNIINTETIKNVIVNIEDVSDVYVSSSGEIFVRMDSINQLIIMAPDIVGSKIIWRCYAAPHRDFCM